MMVYLSVFSSKIALIICILLMLPSIFINDNTKPSRIPNGILNEYNFIVVGAGSAGKKYKQQICEIYTKKNKL